jgi:epoxyqueuosine reductase
LSGGWDPRETAGIPADILPPASIIEEFPVAVERIWPEGKNTGYLPGNIVSQGLPLPEAMFSKQLMACIPAHRFQQGQSRRDFFKFLAVAGAVLTSGRIRATALAPATTPGAVSTRFEYQYRAFSVERLREAKAWFDYLKSEAMLSDNKTFQSYINGFIFDPRAYLIGAKSVILFAVPEQVRSLLVHRQGKAVEILIPCGYTVTGLTGAGIRKQIHADLIRDPAKQVRGRLRLPLKTLAVRSGLAEYGRNNITYVNGYGSFHALYGLITDQELEESWGPLKMLRLCKGCSVCIRECPTRCIRDTDFIIDAGKCISLYNELPDPMPGWITPGVHHALVGCLKCQFSCPGNAEGIRNISRLAELDEQETNFILEQGTDTTIRQRIISKLSLFPPAQDLPWFSRNLRLALANVTPLSAVH